MEDQALGLHAATVKARIQRLESLSNLSNDSSSVRKVSQGSSVHTSRLSRKPFGSVGNAGVRPPTESTAYRTPKRKNTRHGHSVPPSSSCKVVRGHQRQRSEPVKRSPKRSGDHRVPSSALGSSTRWLKENDSYVANSPMRSSQNDIHHVRSKSNRVRNLSPTGKGYFGNRRLLITGSSPLPPKRPQKQRLHPRRQKHDVLGSVVIGGACEEASLCDEVVLPSSPDQVVNHEQENTRPARQNIMVWCRRFWQLVYAVLAVLELLSCPQVRSIVEQLQDALSESANVLRDALSESVAVHFLVHLVPNSELLESAKLGVASLIDTRYVTVVQSQLYEAASEHATVLRAKLMTTILETYMAVVQSQLYEVATEHVTVLRAKLMTTILETYMAVVQSQLYEAATQHATVLRAKLMTTISETYVTEMREAIAPYLGHVFNRERIEAFAERLLSQPWEEVINKLFVVAIIIQAVMESWALASRGKKKEVEAEEAKVKIKSAGVTNRSRNRYHRLERTSTNRHFIMRWTGNRIRWSHATTEILRATCIFVAIHLLFVPVLKTNPFRYLYERRQAPMGPILFLGRKKNIDEVGNKVLSIGEVLITVFHSAASLKLRKQINRLVRRIIGFLLRKPWKVSERVQRVFTFIRWLKFLAPLIGTSNKLRGHCLDYLKKRRLKQRSDAAKRKWETIVRTLNEKQQIDRAVRAIQSAFRLRREQRLNEMASGAVNSPSDNAILAIQKRFRARAALARFHEEKARLEETRKQRIEATLRGKRPVKKRQKKAEPVKRPLLLMPNTAFSVKWKCVTIACAALEIAQLALAPRLSPKNKKVPVELLVQMALTPGTNTTTKLSAIPLMQLYTSTIAWFSLRMAELVSWISFLDVFVTFFTGEIDESTGKLVPKSFFTRWILPGVVLQLVVNPTMKDIASIVQQVLRFAQTVGMMRFIHVAVAILPILNAIVDSALARIQKYVESQNKQVVSADHWKQRLQH